MAESFRIVEVPYHYEWESTFDREAMTWRSKISLVPGAAPIGQPTVMMPTLANVVAGEPD